MYHHFSSSLTQEQQLIEEKKYVPALDKLNVILYERHGCFFDAKTYRQYNGNSLEDKQKQKVGIDAECELFFPKTGRRQMFTWDYKFRFKAFYDFLAETVSVDYCHKPGWAVDPVKENDLIMNINLQTKQVVVVSRVELKDAILSGKFSDIKEKSAENHDFRFDKSYNTKFITIPLNRLKEECPKTIIYSYE